MAAAVLVSSLLVAPALGAGEGAAPVADSTRRVAEELATIAATTDAGLNPMANPGRVNLYRERLTRGEVAPGVPLTVEQRVQLTLLQAAEQLNAGDPEGALATMDAMRLNPPPGWTPTPQVIRAAREFVALCYLRIGERDNCILHHGAESCLAPIQGSGVHTDPRGSRTAIPIYRALAEENPKDLSPIWLLNIATMTVGEWPDSVPPAFRIAPSVFDSEHDLPRFPDVALEAGVAVRGLAGGVIADDFDGDGRLDLVVTSYGLSEPMHFFHNDGEGKFSDRTREAGLEGLTSGLQLTHADYDNDGDLDLLVLRGAWLGAAGHIPLSLLRNRGDASFEDVAAAAGIQLRRPSQTAAWADYDGDGWLDLFVGYESGADKNPSVLWRNQKDGTFADRSELLGDPDLGFVKGSAWGDYDNDGRPDLLVSALDGPKRLFHNDGPLEAGPGDREWAFTEVAAQAGIDGPLGSFSCWFWDYDNDGWLDLFVAPYKPLPVGEVAALYLDQPSKAELPRLYRNLRDGRFRDVSKEVRLDRVTLIMGSNYGDLDNDGWLDLYAGTGGPDLRLLMPNRMFRNQDGQRFQDVTTAGGFGHLQKGHGVAFADLDDDGDQDVYESIGGAFTSDTAQNALFRNPGNDNRWLRLQLVGTRSNRCAIGARVKVKARGDNGVREVHSLVHAGSSFGGNPLRRELGLGDSRGIESVEVVWPTSGLRQTFTGLKLDRSYRIVEGNDRALELPRTPIADAATGAR